MVGSAKGCLVVLATVLFQLVLGLLRLGVIIATYAAGAVVGGVVLLVIVWPTVDPATRWLALLWGSVILPGALSLGFVAWLLPATARALDQFRRGRWGEEDYSVPLRFDAVWLVGMTVVCAVVGAAMTAWVSTWLATLAACLVFAGLAVVSTVVIAVSGGRHVAMIWLAVVAGAAEGWTA